MVPNVYYFLGKNCLVSTVGALLVPGFIIEC
jgi:hypothetical protein